MGTPSTLALQVSASLGTTSSSEAKKAAQLVEHILQTGNIATVLVVQNPHEGQPALLLHMSWEA